MKKFVKLAAVFAALVLALSCFVSCSSDSDDDSVLAGLWIYDDEEQSYGEEGQYVVGTTMYYAFSYGEKYYYFADEPMNFTLSGNEMTVEHADGYMEKITFEISGNKLTLTFYNESGKIADKSTFTKVNQKPIKTTEEDFESMFSED